VSLELVTAKSEVSMRFALALCLLDGSLDIIWPVGILFDGGVLFATDLHSDLSRVGRLVSGHLTDGWGSSHIQLGRS